MVFEDIFARPVDRFMDGVVKPDDDSHLASELDEYVVTPDIARSLQLFCDEYNNPDSDGNGAWISGFYGSGKSHLLKIMSHLLENGDVAGTPALDHIKPKLVDDPSLLASLERACERTPSQSILFNIGGKADSNSGDALLSAFIKTLNERCGYFDGTQAYMAQLERDLDREGLLDDLKQDYESVNGASWEKARKATMLYAPQITASYDRVTGHPAGTTSNVVEHYAKQYHPSAEDFAVWTAEYVHKMERDQPGFRLNFFVDEMGQFIAKNDDRLFALQNVVELLNSKCGRKVWVIVVSQENVEDIVGDLGGKSSKDFSKIQARFKVKMKIPSNDANAVVRDRLLAKAPAAVPALDSLYENHHGDFRVLFDFPNGRKHYDGGRGYADEEDFVATYPLVPYQFDLFHKALTGLSEHSSFSGEYASTGARNMLAVTRSVLIDAKGSGSVEAGDLIPFDRMYDGLQGELRSEVFAAIQEARTNLGSELGVRILKALLLVKYTQEFDATPQNLRVLLYSSLSEDPVKLERDIIEALRDLEAQTYIRRDGDAYQYLTNEEKDVEAEIKREVVETTAIQDEIGKLFRDSILGQNKVTYTNSRGTFSETYAFDVQVDGKAIGIARNELKLNVVTELSPLDPNAPLATAPAKTLECVLPTGSNLVSEMNLWLQTKNYIMRNSDASAGRLKVIADKRDANAKRYEELKNKLAKLVDGARWVALGDVTDQLSGSGTARVEVAVSLLVCQSYPYLRMLDKRFAERDVYAAATGPQGGELFEGALPEYCTETLHQIEAIRSRVGSCTVGGSGASSLVTGLGGGDHGWPPMAVRMAVAELASAGRVDCLRNDEPLDRSDLGNALARGTDLASMVVVPTKAMSSEELEALRSACADITGQAAPQGGPKQIIAAVQAHLTSKLGTYSQAAPKAHALPFAEEFETDLSRLRAYVDHHTGSITEHVVSECENVTNLLAKLDRMAQFAQNRPGVIFADCEAFLREQAANISACPSVSDDVAKLRECLDDPTCYMRSAAPEANGFKNAISAGISLALEAAKARALEDLAGFSDGLKASSDYQVASSEARARVDALIEHEHETLARMDQILAVSGAVDDFKASHSSELLAMLLPPKEVQAEPASGVVETVAPVAPRTVQYRKISKPQSHQSGFLVTAQDVDKFVDDLRVELKGHVAAGERIVL